MRDEPIEFPTAPLKPIDAEAQLRAARTAAQGAQASRGAVPDGSDAGVATRQSIYQLMMQRCGADRSLMYVLVANLAWMRKHPTAALAATQEQLDERIQYVDLLFESDNAEFEAAKTAAIGLLSVILQHAVQVFSASPAAPPSRIIVPGLKPPRDPRGPGRAG